jgi:hypothetical protein
MWFGYILEDSWGNTVKNNNLMLSTNTFPLSAILYKLAHEQEQRDTSALGKSKN